MPYAKGLGVGLVNAKRAEMPDRFLNDRPDLR